VDRALELYRQLVWRGGWMTVKKIGDLLARVNRFGPAAEEYARVAEICAAEGLLRHAVGASLRALKMDPTALESYQRLAELYARLGYMVEAKGQYQIVVDECKKSGDLRGAIQALGKMADIDPDDLKVKSMLADLYERDGNVDKCIEVHITIAESLSKMGYLAEAMQVLERGLKRDPKSGKLRAEQARVHVLQKNWDKAAHVLEEAIRQTPNDPDLQLKLGEAYLGAKKIEKAEDIFRRLLQVDGQDLDARMQMAREAFDLLLPVVNGFLERHEGEKAAALLQQVVQRDQGHIKSLVKLVEAYRGLGKADALVATYRKFSEAYILEGRVEQAAAVLEVLWELDRDRDAPSS
jgi:tetratricopeptide (TPR) repeat protein